MRPTPNLRTSRAIRFMMCSLSGDINLCASSMIMKVSGLSRWPRAFARSEEHTSELQSLVRISYADFCLKIKNSHSQANHLRIHIYTTHQLLPIYLTSYHT